MFVSSDIIMRQSPSDAIVVTDPAVRYRPIRVRGRRYHVTARAPLTEQNSKHEPPNS